MKYNCQDCFYSNFLKDGRVMCDKRLLSEDKKIYIEADKTELPCPAHSHKFIEETRYMYNNKWRHESDTELYCDICRRELNEDEIDQYSYIDVKDKKGEVVDEKLQCRICREKGRR